jgi:hypothetical protein
LAYIVKSETAAQVEVFRHFEAEKAIAWLRQTRDVRKDYLSADGQDLLFKRLTRVQPPSAALAKYMLIEDRSAYPIGAAWSIYVQRSKQLYEECWKTISDPAFDDYVWLIEQFENQGRASGEQQLPFIAKMMLDNNRLPSEVILEEKIIARWLIYAQNEKRLAFLQRIEMIFVLLLSRSDSANRLRAVEKNLVLETLAVYMGRHVSTQPYLSIISEELRRRGVPPQKIVELTTPPTPIGQQSNIPTATQVVPTSPPEHYESQGSGSLSQPVSDQSRFSSPSSMPIGSVPSLQGNPYQAKSGSMPVNPIRPNWPSASIDHFSSLQRSTENYSPGNMKVNAWSRLREGIRNAFLFFANLILITFLLLIMIAVTIWVLMH